MLSAQDVKRTLSTQVLKQGKKCNLKWSTSRSRFIQSYTFQSNITDKVEKKQGSIFLEWVSSNYITGATIPVCSATTLKSEFKSWQIDHEIHMNTIIKVRSKTSKGATKMAIEIRTKNNKLF